jgi:peroxiredoxin
VSTVVPRGPVQPGEPAPIFTLPGVERDGTVSLADYRGKSALLLSINRGLWCSFCRRHIVVLAGMRERLRQVGVETLAIVASPLERARLYVRHRPLNVNMAADPDQVSHRAYGVPRPPLTPEFEQASEKMRVHLEDITLNQGISRSYGRPCRRHSGSWNGRCRCGTSSTCSAAFTLMK